MHYQIQELNKDIYYCIVLLMDSAFQLFVKTNSFICFYIILFFSIPWIETIVVVGPAAEHEKQILENVGT